MTAQKTTVTAKKKHAATKTRKTGVRSLPSSVEGVHQTVKGTIGRRRPSAVPGKPATRGGTGQNAEAGTIKRSVTLDKTLDEAAHRIAGDRGFSEFVNDAVRLRVQQHLIADDIAQYERERGKIPDDVRANAVAKVTAWLSGK